MDNPRYSGQYDCKEIEIEDLKDQIFKRVILASHDDYVCFENAAGELFMMQGHADSGGSNIYLESVDGDPELLLNRPVVAAEEVDNTDADPYQDYWWTFYKLGTNRGVVVFRWRNWANNEFYAVGVNFYKLTRKVDGQPLRIPVRKPLRRPSK